RPRPSAARAVRGLREGTAQSRLRPVLLLPHPGARALPRAVAELAAAGGGRDGVLTRHRHPERHPGRRARERRLGPRRQDLRAAGTVDAVVLGGTPAHPLLLRVPRLAAVLRL